MSSLSFFLYYLKDKGKLELPEALVFETGTNQWKSYDRWPPQAVEKNLYLQAEGKLSFTAPQEESDKVYDAFVSDPTQDHSSIFLLFF